jgi:hypothetical protein
MLARSRSQTRATSRQWRIPKPLPASYCLDRPHIVVDLEEQHELASPGRTACDGEASMTALGQKRTSSVSLQMSASGHERTFMRKRQNVSLGSGAALRLTVSDSFSGPHLHYEVLIFALRRPGHPGFARALSPDASGGVPERTCASNDLRDLSPMLTASKWQSAEAQGHKFELRRRHLRDSSRRSR